MGITSERVQKLESHFDKHTVKTLVFGKWTQALGSVVLVSAGVAKIPFKKFVIFNFLPTLPKSLVFVLIGYFFGYAYVQINHYINYGSIALGVIVFVFLFFYFEGIQTIKKWFRKSI